VTLKDIAQYRMSNQYIDGDTFASAPEMVSRLGAVQAQEYAQTKWGLGLRLPHLKDNDIETDFTAGRILRTHLLRPTWHFVTSEDIRRLLLLTAPRVQAVNAYMYRKLELDNAVFNRCNEIITDTLQGGKQFTRSEINAVFEKNKIIAKGHRLSYIMMNAELEGIVCSGARRGKQFTYTLLEERVPHVQIPDYDEALGDLTNRYFTSRGPATLKDFSTWSGLTIKDCRRGVEMNSRNFERKAIEGKEYYFSRDISSDNKHHGKVYLLPVYDELLMGYKDRSAFTELKDQLKPDAPFVYDCTIVCEDQIIGTWKRTVKSSTIDIAYNLFISLNREQKHAFDAVVRRFEEFTGMAVNVEETSGNK
jgi:hypothetical protein